MLHSKGEANNANYVNAGLSLFILFARLIASRWRRRPLDLSFFLVVLSILLMIARVVVINYYLHLGIASEAIREGPEYLNGHTLSDIEKGTKMWFAGRVFITSILWLQICLLLLFYNKILTGLRWARWMVRLTWAVAGLTYVATILAGFLECRPIHLWWQIDNPGKCVLGYAQLVTQCVSNIVLDLMLLATSYPILLVHGRSWGQHLRVGALFLLGTFCIVVNVVRLASIYSLNSSQPTRTILAAVQIIVSIFVANTPTIYGDINIVWKSRSEAKKRRESRPEAWGTIDSEAGTDRTYGRGQHAARISSRDNDKSQSEHAEEVECANMGRLSADSAV